MKWLLGTLLLLYVIFAMFFTMGISKAHAGPTLEARIENLASLYEEAAQGRAEALKKAEELNGVMLQLRGAQSMAISLIAERDAEAAQKKAEEEVVKVAEELPFEEEAKPICDLETEEPGEAGE